MPLRVKRVLGNIISWSLIGYIQYDIEVPGNLREFFANFPHIFNKNYVGRDGIGPFMEEFA